MLYDHEHAKPPDILHVQLHHHHHHLFAQYAEINSKICNLQNRKVNSFSSNNCPQVQNCNNKNTTIKT